MTFTPTHAEKVASDVIQWIATIVNIIFYFSLTPRLARSYKLSDIGTMAPFPLAMVFVNCTAWCFYGIINGAIQVFWCNFVGACVFFFNYATYAKGCRDRRLIILIVTCTVGFALDFGLFFIPWSMYPGECFAGKDTACHTLTRRIFYYWPQITHIIMFISPSASIVQIVKTKSSDPIEPLFTASAAAYLALWAIAGFLIWETALIYTNLVGCGLNLIQMLLFLIYPRSSKLKLFKMRRRANTIVSPASEASDHIESIELNAFASPVDE